MFGRILQEYKMTFLENKETEKYTVVCQSSDAEVLLFNSELLVDVLKNENNCV